MSMWLLFFFKQKTAYELRISDWSSDVCSSYLIFLPADHHGFDRYPRSSRLCASGYRAGTDINSPDQYSGDQYVRQSGAEHWPGPRAGWLGRGAAMVFLGRAIDRRGPDRKSTRLNSSH